MIQSMAEVKEVYVAMFVGKISGVKMVITTVDLVVTGMPVPNVEINR